MRGPRAICNSRNRGPFSQADSEAQSCFGLEKKAGGEYGLGARTQSLRGGYWDNQKLILLEGMVELLTLDFRITTFPSRRT
jgi:hypothetical protein